MARRYVPRRGDLVWIDFNPQAGREQAGHRPALVISPRLYNAKAGLALFCPITSRQKGYPFEVALPPGLEFSGVILADQLKSLDFAALKSTGGFTVNSASKVNNEMEGRIPLGTEVDANKVVALFHTTNNVSEEDWSDVAISTAPGALKVEQTFLGLNGGRE